MVEVSFTWRLEVYLPPTISFFCVRIWTPHIAKVLSSNTCSPQGDPTAENKAVCKWILDASVGWFLPNWWEWRLTNLMLNEKEEGEVEKVRYFNLHAVCIRLNVTKVMWKASEQPSIRSLIEFQGVLLLLVLIFECCRCIQMLLTQSLTVGY